AGRRSSAPAIRCHRRGRLKQIAHFAGLRGARSLVHSAARITVCGDQSHLARILMAPAHRISILSRRHGACSAWRRPVPRSDSEKEDFMKLLVRARVTAIVALSLLFVV